jgi:signal peptidase I
MTTLDAGRDPATRLVRPWIAALLTFLGWGLGFFYARRPRDALIWAAASLIAPAALVLTVLALAEAGIVDAPGWLRLLPWAATVLVAGWAWRVAAREREVARGPPERLLGYLLLWLVPILVALTLRFAVVQPFRNPSGSMQPAINVGEHFVVTKWSYGYTRYSFSPFEAMLPRGRVFAREPERGDLVVFRPAPEPDRDYIKRLIGLPGDRIQMIDGALHINGEASSRQPLGEIEISGPDGAVEHVPAYRETLPNGVSYVTLDRFAESELDNTREFTVPEGHYFMLGDDRDNSADSRVSSLMGYVPADGLVGRVSLIIGAPDEGELTAPTGRVCASHGATNRALISGLRM